MVWKIKELKPKIVISPGCKTATCETCGALFVFSDDARDNERIQAAIDHKCKHKKRLKEVKKEN